MKSPSGGGSSNPPKALNEICAKCLLTNARKYDIIYIQGKGEGITQKGKSNIQPHSPNLYRYYITYDRKRYLLWLTLLR